MLERSTWGALALAFLFVLLTFASSWNDSPTYDEPEHAVAGLSYVTTGEFWCNPMHPPLWKAVAGLAVATQHPEMPAGVWDLRHKDKAVEAILFAGRNDAQRLIRAARAPLILLLGGFVFAFFLMLRRELGEWAALIATAMLAFCPNFVAHSARVGNDGLAAAAAFTTLWVFNRYRESERTGLWTVALGLSVGLALLTKFSCVLLLGLLPVMLFLGTPRRRLKDICIVGGLSLALLWGGYTVWRVPPDFQQQYNSVRHGGKEPVLLRLARATDDVPVVRNLSWYLTGLSRVSRRLQAPSRYQSLYAGQMHRGGRWTYFPRLLLAKVPSGYLLLTGLALAVSLKNRRRPPSNLTTYLIFATGYLVVACQGQLNLGVRHLLPIFPAIFAFTGWGLAQLSARGPRSLALALYLWAVVSVGQAYPGYLAYYNSFAGGKEGGREIALDSNYDWGADLFRLDLWARQRPQDPVFTLYFGTSLPSYYLGDQYRPIPAVRPREGWLAISVQQYERARLARLSDGSPPEGLPRTALGWVLALRDPLVVGDSFLVFPLSQENAIELSKRTPDHE